MFDKIELIELIFGFSNSLVGIVLVIYVAKSLSSYKDRIVIKSIKNTLWALIFLSAYSFFHFIRELFELKSIYGPIVEIPEYIATLLLFISLVWQLIVFDAPGNNSIARDYDKKKCK